MQTISQRYADIRCRIRNGDLLLYRAGGKLANRLIARSSRSRYAHAGMAAWWGDALMLIEMLQTGGGRAVKLSSQIEGWPRQWDWYRSNPLLVPGFAVFDRGAAMRAMRDLTGRRYGWSSLWRLFVRRLPVVRLLIRPADDDQANGQAPHCSCAVSRACRAGGVDPVPNLADWATDPADLSRSPFFEYQCTLF